MRIISRRALREFWAKHPDAEQPLQAWYANAKHADWKTPFDVKATYQNASIVANNRVVFNIIVKPVIIYTPTRGRGYNPRLRRWRFVP